MAIIHSTTMSPTKLELLASWLPAQPWYLDQGREPVARYVGDVRLAPVEGGDDVLEHVDEQDGAAGLGERGRERDADIAGADDRDVVVGALSHGRQG